jgi:hypothetical protein
MVDLYPSENLNGPFINTTVKLRHVYSQGGAETFH